MAVAYQVSMDWTEMIDGNIGEGCLLSEVWWVLYCHGRSKGSWGIMVEFDFGVMREVRAIDLLLSTVMML
jgi:hypothetical protein